jgi:hypothetical protein
LGWGYVGRAGSGGPVERKEPGARTVRIWGKPQTEGGFWVSMVLRANAKQSIGLHGNRTVPIQKQSRERKRRGDPPTTRFHTRVKTGGLCGAEPELTALLPNRIDSITNMVGREPGCCEKERDESQSWWRIRMGWGCEDLVRGTR